MDFSFEAGDAAGSKHPGFGDGEARELESFPSLGHGFALSPRFSWGKDEPRLHRRWRLQAGCYPRTANPARCHQVPSQDFLVSRRTTKLLASAYNCPQTHLIPAYASHMGCGAAALFSPSSRWKQLGKTPGLTHSPSKPPPCTHTTPMWGSAGWGSLDGCRSGCGWEMPPPRTSSSLPTHLSQL